MAGRKQGPRVVLVTGATGGIGRACCEELAGAETHLVAIDLHPEALHELITVLCERSASAEAAAVDVTDASAVDAAVNRVVDAFGRIDIVVNLAGVARNAPLARITDEDFALTMDTHVGGTLHMMRAASPTMRTHRFGRIVNMSSIAVRGTVAGGAYGAAKGAIEGLTRSAAMELARHGVSVNCVAPGLVNAGIFLTTPDAYRAELTERIPAGRLAEPGEIAHCVAFLASPRAGYITGQTITMCGGLSLGF